MPKIGLISDIHANLLALQAVFDDFKAERIDTFWVLGDVLGYGPRPLQTWQLIDKYQPSYWLLGNHDGYVIPKAANSLNDENEISSFLRGPVYCDIANGRVQVDGPNEIAWEIAKRHRKSLAQSNFAFDTARLMPQSVKVEPNIFLAHGSFFDPPEASSAFTHLEHYIYTPEDAELVYSSPYADWGQASAMPILHITGHTHVALLWERPHELMRPNPLTPLHPEGKPALGKAYELKAGHFYHINPGSVGFPSKFLPCPTYAILDTDEWTVQFYTVRNSYNPELTRRQMASLGYPQDAYSHQQLQPCISQKG